MSKNYKPTFIHYFYLFIFKMSMPVRVMKLIGIEYLIVTNAAGGLNKEKLKIGDFMVINDHINIPGFSGINSLTGPNEQR